MNSARCESEPLLSQSAHGRTALRRLKAQQHLNRKVLPIFFYWHHSGFNNDSKDRLQSEMTIAKGLRLLNFNSLSPFVSLIRVMA